MSDIEYFAVIDTETTGLPENPDARVIEMGVALFSLEDGSLARSFSTLVCPDVLSEDGIALAGEISGITEAEIRAALPPAEAWAACGEFLDGWRYPIHAYNLEFDRIMCERTFETEGTWWAGCIMEEFSLLWACCFGHDPETGRPIRASLRRAARIAEIEWGGQAHRAEADAIVAGRIFALLRANKLQPPEQANPVGVLVTGGRPDRRDASSVVIGPLIIGSGKAPSLTCASDGTPYVAEPRRARPLRNPVRREVISIRTDDPPSFFLSPAANLYNHRIEASMRNPKNPDLVRRQAFRTLLASFRELAQAEQEGTATPEDRKSIVLGLCDSLDAVRLVIMTRENLTEREIGLFQQCVGAYAGILMTEMMGEIDGDIGRAPFRSLFEEEVFDDDDDEAPAKPASVPVAPA